jgi:predicted dehydrogenase
MPEKIRFGLVGSNISSAWVSASHLPALLASADVELTAVCTTRAESAEEARTALGARFAFDDYREMVKSPEIEAVGVVIRVPRHYEVTKAAIAAGKHVFTEWPLGRNTSEATELAELARDAGIQTVVGLQARLSPTLMYVRELLDAGYLGEVLTYGVTGFRNGGAGSRPAGGMWQADVNNGVNPLTVHFGHVVDALRFVAGDFESVRGTVSIAIPEWFEAGTNHSVTVTAPDNVIVSGRLLSGAVASVQVAAVPWAGPGFRMQIYGRDGTIVVTNSVSPQRGEASRLQIARGSNELADVEIPDRFNYLTPEFPEGDPFNVGQLYHQFAAAIRTGENHGPSFDTAVSLHRLLDAVRSSSESGREAACS